MATTATKVGAADAAAGAGVGEFLGLTSALAAMSQVVTPLPFGDPWQIGDALSHTPTIITVSFPPSPVLAWRVPEGKALLFTGGTYTSLTAGTDYLRVRRRYFLGGAQGTAAPAAPAAPSVALLTLTDGIGTSGAYLYKIAPIDAFRQEGPLSVASASSTLTSTSRGVAITPPALGTGVIGYNVYRTLAGGSTYYYVGTTCGINAYADAAPDSNIDQTKTPSNNWATGWIAGETMDGPGDVVLESGTPAVTGAPTILVYSASSNGYATSATTLPRKMAQAVTFPTTIGQRIRASLYSGPGGFVPVPTATNNYWRGPFINDSASRHDEELGVTAVSGVDALPSAGQIMVWGHQTIGMCERVEATAAIKATRIVPTHPQGMLIPPRGEIVCEIGALANGVASVRDVSLCGMLYPTTGT